MPNLKALPQYSMCYSLKCWNNGELVFLTLIFLVQIRSIDLMCLLVYDHDNSLQRLFNIAILQILFIKHPSENK